MLVNLTQFELVCFIVGRYEIRTFQSISTNLSLEMGWVGAFACALALPVMTRHPRCPGPSAMRYMWWSRWSEFSRPGVRPLYMLRDSQDMGTPRVEEKTSRHALIEPAGNCTWLFAALLSSTSTLMPVAPNSSRGSRGRELPGQKTRLSRRKRQLPCVLVAPHGASCPGHACVHVCGFFSARACAPQNPPHRGQRASTAPRPFASFDD